MSTDLEGFWLIYDGECPVCHSVAQAIAIREIYGALNLVDARTDPDNLVCLRARAEGLDLDEGMVIYANGEVFHGAGAVSFLATFGASTNLLTRVSKVLNCSNGISALTYRMLRALRNILLWLRGIGRIDNLRLSDQPTFKPVFGDDWEHLPPVIRRHYEIRPFSDDLTVVEGSVDVMCSGPVRLLGPLLGLMGQIPCKNERDVPVTVVFRSDPRSAVFQFHRVFRFRKGGNYVFRSRMLHVGDGEVIEIMRFGFFWRCRYSWDGQKVNLSHRGYGIRVLGLLIPLPLELLIGTNQAEDVPVNEKSFDMMTQITHPWWGRVYEYRGRFNFPEGV